MPSTIVNYTIMVCIMWALCPKREEQHSKSLSYESWHPLGDNILWQLHHSGCSPSQEQHRACSLGLSYGLNATQSLPSILRVQLLNITTQY